jgi:hypothetical protein
LSAERLALTAELKSTLVALPELTDFDLHLAGVVIAINWTLPKLRRLTLRSRPAGALQRLDCPCMESLVDIGDGDARPSGTFSEKLSLCTSLTSLELVAFGVHELDGLSFVTPRLRVLRLKSTPLCVSTLAQLLTFGCWPRLEEAQLLLDGSVGASVLPAVLSTWPLLRHLKLTNVWNACLSIGDGRQTLAAVPGASCAAHLTRLESCLVDVGFFCQWKCPELSVARFYRSYPMTGLRISAPLSQVARTLLFRWSIGSSRSSSSYVLPRSGASFDA